GVEGIRREQSETSCDTADQQHGSEDGAVVFTQHTIGRYRKVLDRHAVGYMVGGEASRVRAAPAAVLAVARGVHCSPRSPRRRSGGLGSTRSRHCAGACCNRTNVLLLLGLPVIRVSPAEMGVEWRGVVRSLGVVTF